MARSRATAITVVVLALVLGACGGADATAKPETSTSTTVAPAEDVSVRSVSFVDTSRPTPAEPARDEDALPDRTLETILVQPTSGGLFPLVVFAHGLEGQGAQLLQHARTLARAGYLVALPTFPLTSGFGAGITDYVNQPADISFVIDSVLNLAADPDDPLADKVDAERIALAGHSLGSVSVHGAAYNSCCIDNRVDAAIMIAAFELPFPNGTLDDRPAIPLLVIHGQQDDVIPIAQAEAVYAAAAEPALLVRFPTGDHANMLFPQDADDEALVEITDETMTAFLDRYLRGDAEALDRVSTALAGSELATFDAKGAA